MVLARRQSQRPRTARRCLGNPYHGGIEQNYFYDAYGSLLNMQASQAATPLLYNGEMFDALTGNQYLRARYYNPANAQFNRLDPFFGNHQDPQSFNKYAYVHGDPISLSDPSGLFPVSLGQGYSRVLRCRKKFKFQCSVRSFIRFSEHSLDCSRQLAAWLRISRIARLFAILLAFDSLKLIRTTLSLTCKLCRWRRPLCTFTR